MTGHNKIKMTDLATLYRKLGLKDAETFIQSGNVIFNNRGNQPVIELASGIEQAIRKKFSYNIPALIRTEEELKSVIDANPFINEDNYNPERLAVIFLYQIPDGTQVEKVKNIDYPPDKFRIIGREIFIYCPDGFGRTKLYTNFFENKMKVTGTARNWRTINTIYELVLNKGKQAQT